MFFWSSSVASSPHGGGPRTALQPQLLTVSNYSSEDAVLSNAVSLLNLMDKRTARVPIPIGIWAFGMRRHGDLPAWLVGESLLGVTPLSQAIVIDGSFDDCLVLQENQS